MLTRQIQCYGSGGEPWPNKVKQSAQLALSPMSLIDLNGIRTRPHFVRPQVPSFQFLVILRLRVHGWVWYPFE